MPYGPAILISHNAETWKFKRALLHNEEHYRAKTLQNIKLLEGLASVETKTSEALTIFCFRKL